MSEQERETFLARWSRRKREAAEEKATPSAPSEDAVPLADECEEAVRLHAQAAVAPDAGGQDADTAAAKFPAIDLDKLPPIESITATTDIRPFLTAGVPEQLKYAALRRAWVVDPTIRNFVGIAENQWDFTAPGGAPGFGPLLPVDDVRRLVAQVIGHQADAAAPEASQTIASQSQPAAGTEEFASLPAPDDRAASPADTATRDDAVRSTLAELSGSEDELIVQDDNIDAALRNIEADEADEGQNKPSGRRTHGSALPK